MKYSKVAAAMAGSVIAIGVGAPAFAADASAAAPAMPTSINGGVDQLFAAQPVEKVVDSTPVGSTASKLDQALPTQGLPVQASHGAKGGPLSALGGLPIAGLLGGLPLNGLPLG